MVWFALLFFIAFEIFMGMYRAHKESKTRWLITYRYAGQETTLLTNRHPAEFWRGEKGITLISVTQVPEHVHLEED